MTDQSGAEKQENAASPEPADATSPAGTASAGAASAGAAQGGAAPANQNEAAAADSARLQAEVADLKDRLLRTLAELENVNRRRRIEVADAGTYAVTSFAREVLAIGDNLQRTIEALPREGADAESPVVKSLVEGVAVTAREFLKILGKFNVRRLEPLGERFDPNFHQAMYEVPTPNVPNGTIVEVHQAGYAIGDRTLRPALVGIAKGGPKTTPAPSDATPEPPSA